MLTLTDPDLVRNQCLIDGIWRGDGVTAVTNPANGEMLAHVPAYGADQANEAVLAAERAFKPWSARLAKDRAVILRRWFDLIIANRQDLARLLTAEQGKPLSEALGEIDYAAAYVEFYAEQAKRIAGETLPSHRGDGRILVLRQPSGVVAAITPWNFPAAMVTRKVAPALAAGCTVVLKPAGETPLTALALADLAQRAGVDAGAFNVITGPARAIGGVLTSHPAVRVVSFTGSTEVGKLLMAQCATTVKKVALELGGNAPFIVFDDADLDAAVEGAIASKFRNAGQTCVCTNRIFVQRSVEQAFTEKLAAAIGALKVDQGLADGAQIGPMINEAAIGKIEEHIADALQHGAALRLGGRRHELGGTFFEPTLVSGVTDDMLVASEETFGPLAAVFVFDSEAEVIRRANATPFGLAAYVYSRDIGRVFRVTEGLDYGMVGTNSGLISTELAPFGGVKESGNSREGSHHGIEEYLEKKYMFVGGLG